MKVLNKATLSEAMMHCHLLPEYKAVIVFKDSSSARDFIRGMREELRRNCSNVSISRAGIVKFKNGSYIRPITLCSGVRGMHVNEIICGSGVEEVDQIFARIYEHTYHCCEEESASETLDDFLNEFTILQKHAP